VHESSLHKKLASDLGVGHSPTSPNLLLINIDVTGANKSLKLRG